MQFSLTSCSSLSPLRNVTTERSRSFSVRSLERVSPDSLGESDVLKSEHCIENRETGFSFGAESAAAASARSLILSSTQLASLLRNSPRSFRSSNSASPKLHQTSIPPGRSQDDKHLRLDIPSAPASPPSSTLSQHGDPASLLDSDVEFSCPHMKESTDVFDSMSETSSEEDLCFNTVSSEQMAPFSMDNLPQDGMLKSSSDMCNDFSVFRPGLVAMSSFI